MKGRKAQKKLETRLDAFDSLSPAFTKGRKRPGSLNYKKQSSGRSGSFGGKRR